MSSRTSPAVLPDPKRPRLLAPGDAIPSTPAVPLSAPNALAHANYTGRVPAPTQAVASCERTSYPATQKVTASSAQSSSDLRPHAAGTSYPSSSSSNSVQARPSRSGLYFTDADDNNLITFLGRGLPDIVIAALLDRTPQEVQREIRCRMFWHDGDMADGPQVRPAYTPEDYRRLLKMHRCGESAERIALVLGRSTSSVINHFRKRKPIWLEAGEQVEPEWILRDKDIDYDDRIQRELASSAADTVAKIAKSHLYVVPRPAPSIPSGSPSTSGSSLQAGTAKSAENSGTTIAKPLLPDFKFGKDAPAPRSTASSKPSRPPPAMPLSPQFRFGNDAPAPPRSSATVPTPTPTTAAAAEPPKVNLRTKLRLSTSTSVVDSAANLPAGAHDAASAPAPPCSTGFLTNSTRATVPPKVNLHFKLGQATPTSVVDPPITLPAPARTATTPFAPAPVPSSIGFSAYSTAAAAPPKVDLRAKLGRLNSTSVVDTQKDLPAPARTVATSSASAPASTGFLANSTCAAAPAPTAAAPPKVKLLTKFRPPSSTSIVEPRKELPAAARTVAASPATAPAPSSIGFSAYSTAASLVPIAFNSSLPPAPSLVTKPVPTSAPWPTAAAPAPSPVKPVLQDVKPAAHPAPPPAPTSAPIPTIPADPDASSLSPMSDDDSPPSLSQRLPNPVPHHAPHLPLLPLWCDGHYEQGMSGLKRFLQLVEGSRKSRTRASTSSS
ncbi:hypothetical protein JCM8115_002637 [Rhodotorula mucilaginosa]